MGGLNRVYTPQSSTALCGFPTNAAHKSDAPTRTETTPPARNSPPQRTHGRMARKSSGKARACLALSAICRACSLAAATPAGESSAPAAKAAVTQIAGYPPKRNRLVNLGVIVRFTIESSRITWSPAAMGIASNSSSLSPTRTRIAFGPSLEVETITPPFAAPTQSVTVLRSKPKAAIRSRSSFTFNRALTFAADRAHAAKFRQHNQG